MFKMICDNARLSVGVTVLYVIQVFVESFRYGSFQNRLVQCDSAKEFVYPQHLKSLQHLVIQAVKANKTVKPLGGLYSVSDIVCTEGTPIRMTKISHFNYDNVTKQATVGAGITLHNFLEKLHEVGRTIEGISSYGDITLGGALATGSHGSGLRHPATVLEYLVSAVLVDGVGQVRFINDHPSLRALKTNLGLLGIVYELTLTTVPQFKLSIEHKVFNEDILWKNGSTKILEIIKSRYRSQIWWFPSARTMVLSVGDKVGIDVPGECQTHFVSEAPRGLTKVAAMTYEFIQKARSDLAMSFMEKMTMLSLVTLTPGRSPIFSEDGKTLCPFPAIGYNHRMLSNRCHQCAWDHGNDSLSTQEFAVALRLEEFPEAIETLRTILRESPTAFPLNGIFIRFLQATDGYLSINEVDGHIDQGTVIIDWGLVGRKNLFEDHMLGLATSQAMVQALIMNHRGRPFYIKNGRAQYTGELMSERYPNYERFVEYVRELDPFGIFLNDFGRRILPGPTSSRKKRKGCALVTDCICSDDEDCSSGSQKFWEARLTCRNLQGFNVCQEN